jgi:hypothetical protein
MFQSKHLLPFAVIEEFVDLKDLVCSNTCLPKRFVDLGSMPTLQIVFRSFVNTLIPLVTVPQEHVLQGGQRYSVTANA